MIPWYLRFFLQHHIGSQSNDESHANGNGNANVQNVEQGGQNPTKGKLWATILPIISAFFGISG